ncbi:SDR family NAD(P)-dependent oxidoreductase [Spiractinospora alimapuensis]|uniref:SDR family NAD(P)-dependent oxidoreductase n=1 Tax=Spiractinospora alimapuensis TaxID=2820884 RepID=UPI001F2DF1CE|nr:SDR family NAD(P)-dependent oxidoreductase [Spiractinospora alimapuensis]QVQ51263.1 SDR family NAD(P)-dependent oxidoreductase [Spiractinospora alimapuensis]
MSDPTQPNRQRPDRQRVVVISGGTDGMGRELAMERLARGDRAVVLGSNAEKGRRLLADAAAAGAGDRMEFIAVDLSSVSATRAAIDQVTERHPTVDALGLFANRQAPKRIVTEEGLERTFALYYLSRYLLGHGLAAALRQSETPVIINVAGTGATAGEIHWDDLQLERRYSTITAQLQAGRANDLLGVAYAAQAENPARYVLYHPGFTRSGDLSPLPAPVRLLLRVAARLAARPVKASVAPIHDFIERPPSEPLSAIDRGKSLPLDLKTLDPANAERLAEVTEALLRRTPLS